MQNPVRVNRENLLHSLESVKSGLAPKDIIEQSSCFVFKDGRVWTYNDEASCNGPSPLNGKFVGAVKAEKFLEVLRKLEEDELDVETTDSELIVRGKNRRSGVYMEQQILLPVDVVEKPKTWEKLPDEFCDAVAVVKECAGADSSRPALMCVHIHPKWLETCDSYQICRWRMKTGISQPTLIRKKSIEAAVELGVNEFSETDRWVHFRNAAGFVVSCRKYEDEFPPLTKLFEVEGTSVALPKGLYDAVEKAQIFSAENAVENNQVTVRLQTGKLRVRGEGVSGWYTEVKKVKYEGPTIEFMIAPKVLGELVKRHSECVISPTKIKVNGGSYIYATVLSQVESEEEKPVATATEEK
jgi:hypothetical protein